MTKRKPISALQNVWFDSQQVDADDLTVEQSFNNAINSATINNHIGTGVLPENLIQNIIFDSYLTSGYLDGTAISPQNQPSDNNFGNQLEIELIGSLAAGRRKVKVGVIGLDFNGNLQYETFTFATNEVQVGYKHFAKILILLFNDLLGPTNKSFNLGGRLIIRETKPMSLSRDVIMSSQDIQPNIFWRDFFVTSAPNLQKLLKAALPLYNIDNLNIYTGVLENKSLDEKDVTTQVGQKFLATTNNIQKVTLLMSVENTNPGSETDLNWTGDLIVSIYPLQSILNCPVDLAPNLDIDFDPAAIPLAQLSFNYSSLLDIGIKLDNNPQPVDFIFSNTPVANGTVVEVGKYYAVTVKRAGTANKCNILLAVGDDFGSNSRITTFTGSVWVDEQDRDLWFRIYTDAAKVSDGQAYDSGFGVQVEKTKLNSNTGVTEDYCLNNLYFNGSDTYRAIVTASTEKSDPVQDQRTGNTILARQEFVPYVELLNTLDLTNLENVSDPLLIGAIADKNVKYTDPATNTIQSSLYSSTIINNEVLIKVVDDPTDVVRYNPDISSLGAKVLSGAFTNAKFIPHVGDGYSYKVAEAKTCQMLLGDINGDGIIDEKDLELLNSYLGFNMNIGLPKDSVITVIGSTCTFINGYSCLSKPFSNLFGISFKLVNKTTNVVLLSGSDGVLIANPLDPRLAQFTSSSVNFTTVVGIADDYKLVLLNPSSLENYGGFEITGIDTVTDTLSIRKIYLTSETLSQIMRADIDGDFEITANDGYLLEHYINRSPVTTPYVGPYPGPTTNPYNKISKPFEVIKFKLEGLVDRNDDYSSLTTNRSTVLHPLPDIFNNDGYFETHNYYNFPVTFQAIKRLSWEEDLVVCNSNTKLVPAVFATSSGHNNISCDSNGNICNLFSKKPDFDPGRVDFFVPNNIIINDGGQLVRPDGYNYKVDFEYGNIVLEIPDGLFGTEKTINIMEDFVVDDGYGLTKKGFPAMRFADCSTVKLNALSLDQIRFAVAVQSFSPNLDGVDVDGYTGAIVDGKMGIHMDHATGLLTLNFTNLYKDPILTTLSTKVQISVFLKKGGFNNQLLYVDSTKVQNMLSLISVFSGPIAGGPSALVDLTTDVSKVLPIINGGTGLNTVGATGTVLMSNGSSLSYQFITSSNVLYTPLNPAYWATTSPTTVQEAIDRMASLLYTLNGSAPIPV